MAFAQRLNTQIQADDAMTLRSLSDQSRGAYLGIQVMAGVSEARVSLIFEQIDRKPIERLNGIVRTADHERFN
jgi:hypothetical protein